MNDVLRKQQQDAWRLFPPVAPPLADGENSARALIARISEWAKSIGRPLSEWDSWALRTPFFDVVNHGLSSGFSEEGIRQVIAELNNRVVDYVRAAITYEKQFEDTLCIQASPSARVPIFWEIHYEYIFVTELTWTLSFIMQNVFLGNSFNGEKRPWLSPYGNLVA